MTERTAVAVPIRWGMFALALVGAIPACSTMPRHRVPDLTIPQAYEQNPQVQAPVEEVMSGWWQRFSSQELDALMRQALASNLDLSAALHRIEQARAQARIADAALLPALEGRGSVSHALSRSTGTASGRSGGASDGSAGGDMTDDSGGDLDNDEAQGRSDTASTGSRTRYQGVLSASYEIDLWGKNRAARAAAHARLASSEFDRDAVLLVLQADLAAAYFDALSLQERLAIARHNLEIAHQLLGLIRTRFEAGATSALEVAQQGSAVASQEAAIPPLEQQLQADLYTIAVLLGRVPEGFRLRASGFEGLRLPGVGTGIPSQLLQRRPDLRRAETELKAANADIGAARAAYFPSLSLNLTDTFSWSASAGGNGLLSAGAAVAVPIFQGGRLRGGVQQAEARHAELIENYKKTVLVALQEVETAALSVRTRSQRAVALAQSVEAAREAYRLARARFDAGAADFLTLLDAQRTLLTAEDAVVQADLDRYTAAVSLFEALGDSGSGACCAPVALVVAAESPAGEAKQPPSSKVYSGASGKRFGPRR